MKSLHTLALICALCLLPNLAAAQLSSDPGFAVTGAHPLGGPSAYGSLADGRYVTFDGLSFDLYAGDGTWQSNLGSISSFMWPSFVEVDPTGSYVVAGESTNGNLFKVQLNGAGVTLLAKLVFQPAADKTLQRAEVTRFRNSLIREAFVMLADERSPRFIESRINSYLDPDILALVQQQRQG